jgi:hypothetical protein
MSWVDVIGYAASVTVLATFCMTTMSHLRLLAIGSNILFICFGALAHIHPVLFLHIILLPVNVARLIQIRRRVNAYRVLGRTSSRLPIDQSGSPILVLSIRRS